MDIKTIKKLAIGQRIFAVTPPVVRNARRLNPEHPMALVDPEKVIEVLYLQYSEIQEQAYVACAETGEAFHAHSDFVFPTMEDAFRAASRAIEIARQELSSRLHEWDNDSR